MIDLSKTARKSLKFLTVFLCLCILIIFISAQETEEYEQIDSTACLECHETDSQDVMIPAALTQSTHSDHECLDCHIHRDTMPHKEIPESEKKIEGCKGCHDDIGEEYIAHGRAGLGEVEEMPKCADCHGAHDILPSSDENSHTNVTNLPRTCGVCHEDLNITQKFEIMVGHPVEIYETSVHGAATKEGWEEAASCNDCHSREGTSHKIYGAGHPESSINHFNVPHTCGKCHEVEEKEYNEGIHGILLARGMTDTPTCNHCHGEHGILSPTDPRSPVSKARVATATCEPCHESIALTEKYGFSDRRPAKFIDTYHGLKSQSGDIHVANCASCHGFHKVLPSYNPESTIHPNNLQHTCGECHTGITAELAAEPIHWVREDQEKSVAGQIVAKVYIIAIIFIIGFMALHWTLDFIRRVILITKKPQVRRMNKNEVWQHTLLLVSFFALVVTGFSLRFGEFWATKFLFGWDQGAATRGIIHRVAAVVMILSTIWHFFFLFTRRGKGFLKDMLPKWQDVKDIIIQLKFYFGLSKKEPRFARFGYVEKAEYWALIWGNVVMIFTGLLLWFDNFFVKLLPKWAIDVALVIHFYEAILATLAILIWHLYSTVFSPKVYPMNPSWLTGKMPRDMFIHEHPEAEIEELE